MSEKPKSVAWRIIDNIKLKIKEKAKDNHEFLVLHKNNPELAEFIGELEGVMAEEVVDYFTKHPT